jgi:hypothetical protein
VLGLGITVAVCEAITGDEWTEIYPGSAFMASPGTLQPSVGEYVKVVTDEQGACRREGEGGRCAESDYVFAPREQYNAAVDGDRRATGVQVRAGHVEIVGERGTPPTKLLDVLEGAADPRGHIPGAPRGNGRAARPAVLSDLLY